MGTVRLPHGPWKSLLIGKYENKDVSIYQNPNKDILYVVVDRSPEGKARGLVVTVYRAFFVERGELSALISHISGSPVGVAKKWKGELFRFLLVPAGIKYVGLEPKELSDTVDEMVNTLNRLEKNILMLAKTLGISMRPLSFAPRSVAAILFTEPSVIAGLSPVGASPSTTAEGTLILGFTRSGDVVRESPDNFRRTVVYGHPEGRRRFFLVLLEEFLRNGINVVLLTRDASTYEGLRTGGTQSEELKKVGLRPLGLPVEVEEAVIDISTVPADVFVELIGIKYGTETAKRLAEVLGTVENEERPGQLAEKINDTDMLSLRVSRILKAVDLVKGEVFRRLTFNRFVSIASTGLGAAHIIEANDPWSFLSFFSILVGVGDALSRRGKTENLRLAVFIEEGERILGKEGGLVARSLVQLLEKFKDFGMGWVIEAEKDTNLSEELLALSESKVAAVGEDDIAVKTLIRRPYRMRPRPFITSVEATPSPSTSFPQALRPGRT